MLAGDHSKNMTIERQISWWEIITTRKLYDRLNTDTKSPHHIPFGEKKVGGVSQRTVIEILNPDSVKIITTISGKTTSKEIPGKFLSMEDINTANLSRPILLGVREKIVWRESLPR